MGAESLKRTQRAAAAATAALALLAGGCAAHEPAPKVAAPAVWNGTHGLTADDVELPGGGVAQERTDVWPCDLPMTIRTATAPGVDPAALERELAYPVATLRALGYRVTVAGATRYVADAQVPDGLGEVTVAVTADPADQPLLTHEGEVWRAAAQPWGPEGVNNSGVIVVDERRGLAGDVILHELGHLLGLEHKQGTVMQAEGQSPAMLDAAEVATVACR